MSKELTKAVTPQIASGGMTLIPPQYRQDALEVVCDTVLDGKLIEDAAKLPDMPPPIFFKKALLRDDAFREKFVEAQKLAALIDAAEIKEISEGNDGNEIARDRL